MSISKSKHRTQSSDGQQRETFHTSRLLEFASTKELCAQTGHEVHDWPLVILKELVDNALDACEEAGIAPEIAVSVDDSGITVVDNGPGIPAETIDGILDFSVRVSSREAYVAPDRGAQGNALKTIIAMPFALTGSAGEITIDTSRDCHQITVQMDRIRQEPVISRAIEAGFVKNGTSITVRWPDSACLMDDGGNGHFLQNGDAELDSARLLTDARGRFLQLAGDFAWLNPHMTLSVDWYGEHQHFEATNPDWKKWKPSQRTCPHWYAIEDLKRLIAACITRDQQRGADRTVREFISMFNGLASTLKQKQIAEAAGLNRMTLSSLVEDGDLNHEKTIALLHAMQSGSRAVKPSRLGVIGKDHFRRRAEQAGCEMESFEYRKEFSHSVGLPRVTECVFAAFPEAFRGEERERRLITGVNWSAGIENPFRRLGKHGSSLDSVLAEQHASAEEPVLLALHVAYPDVEYRDRGKSSVVTASESTDS